MNRPKRVILLLTEILMLIAGICGILIFIGITLSVVRSRSVADIPSADVINSTTETWRLKGMAEDGYGKFQALASALATLRWYFLGLGGFLFVSSIIHFCLTPWKLKDKAKAEYDN